MSLQLYPNARTDTYTPEHTHAHTQTDACIQHTHARRSSHTITYYKKKSKISFNISPQFTDMVSSYGPVVHVLDPRRGHTTIIYFLWPIYPTLSSQSVHSPTGTGSHLHNYVCTIYIPWYSRQTNDRSSRTHFSNKSGIIRLKNIYLADKGKKIYT